MGNKIDPRRRRERGGTAARTQCQGHAYRPTTRFFSILDFRAAKLARRTIYWLVTGTEAPETAREPHRALTPAELEMLASTSLLSSGLAASVVFHDQEGGYCAPCTEDRRRLWWLVERMGPRRFRRLMDLAQDFAVATHLEQVPGGAKVEGRSWEVVDGGKGEPRPASSRGQTKTCEDGARPGDRLSEPVGGRDQKRDDPADLDPPSPDFQI